MDFLGDSICPYCGVGCRLRFEGVGNQVLKVRGDPKAAANLGRICAKGAQLGPTIATPDRLTHPLLRRQKGGPLERVSWDDALGHVAERFQSLRNAHGPDAFGFYGSGQLDTETCYLVTKLFKGHLGCNNTDSNSRLCMAAAVAGYRTSLGSDGPPGCYEDIELADVILIIGSNMAEAHPVLFDRVRDTKRSLSEIKVIVVDPRETATASIADLHVPVKPGGDIAFLNALGRMLLLMGAVDDRFTQAHTRGFEDYQKFLLEQDLSELCLEAGLTEGQILRVARLIAASSRFLSFYCMGLNQSIVGMWKNNCLINLHLMTGQIGKPGAGPFSLTGQPNAMGGRESGLLCQQLPGYRTVDDDVQRGEVEAYWNLPAGQIKPRPGLSAVEMFRSLERGQLKALWIAGTNPAVSLPDLHQVQRALARAELVVVQDAYHPTETTLLADVVLPVAQWGEKEWTSTNSERMIAYSPKLWEPPGEAWPDWQIIARFAERLGFNSFAYESSAQVWDEFIGLTRGRPCDMAGATSDRLRREASIQWPCPTLDHPGTKRRYLDGQFATPDGKAVFHCREQRSPYELPDHEFPMVLTTGRLYSHWHTLTRTAKADKLMRREPVAFVEIGTHDAAALAIQEGDLVQISSRRGTVQLPAKLKHGLPRGLVFVPFHWGDLFNAGNAANYLTISATGRIAKQPELKYCAVHVAKAPVLQPRTDLPTLSAPTEGSPLNPLLENA